MDKTPKFSIIVPVYNVRNYLEICMESLINQTLKDIEIICVNDGSTDDSLDILNKYAEQDYRIKIYDKLNGGISSARNLGLDMAEGDFVLFVDSDDILEKNACDRLYIEILQTGVDMVVFGTMIFPGYVAERHTWLRDNLQINLRHYKGDCVEALFKEKVSKPFIWNKCFRRSIIEENHIRFDEELSLGEDNLFLFEIFPKVEQVVYISDQLYRYRCERTGSLMYKGMHDLEWRMKMHFSIVEKVLSIWDENGIIMKNQDELFSWIVYFLGNDLISLQLNEERKKEQAKKIVTLMEKYGFNLKKQNLKKYARNIGYKLKKLVSIRETGENIMRETIECVAKDRCTGCGACYNKCPVGAIKMEYNKEGFLFPYVNKEKCIKCGLCQNVCPEMNMEQVQARIHEEGKCYASMAADDIRMVSSSGGMFTLIADYIYEQKGIVCGAVYSEDYQEVYHIISENRADLQRLRGSKYVQSDTRDTYKIIEKALDEDRQVLFVGCPCQVSGLYSFLGKQYDNLYTVDLICHGANSVYAYQSYISEIANGRTIKSVNFRDKSVFGWSTPVTIQFTDGTCYNAAWNQNKWYDCFLEGIINRECCSSCHYAQKKRIGDITLGDFWQVQRWDESCNDWKGTSLVLVNDKKGEYIYSVIKDKLKLSKKASIDFAAKYNGQLVRPNKKSEGRKYFFKHLNKDGYHKAWWYGHMWRYDVGLVGWWFAANYGSVLTYYALGRILEDMDLLPVMIRIPKMDGTGWEDITQKNIEFMQKYFPVSKPRKYEDIHECNQFCDAFMLGSDQLWVSFYNSMVGYTFFLDFADESKRKIAYATSIGRDKYEGNEEDKKIVRTLLKRFDAISVRESSGVEICKNEFDIEAVRRLDPVFLCDIKYYDLLAENSKLSRDCPYILCYILDPTEEKRQAIRLLEEKYGMKSIVILDMKTFQNCSRVWITENIIYNVGIEEFIYFIKNCSYMITDSHHGACFAMIYHKNFTAIANERRGKTRFESLFSLLNINESLLEENQLVNKILEVPDVDYKKVDNILENEKRKSKEWLKQAFESENLRKENSVEIELFSKYLNLAKRLSAKLKDNV